MQGRKERDVNTTGEAIVISDDEDEPVVATTARGGMRANISGATSKGIGQPAAKRSRGRGH